MTNKKSWYERALEKSEVVGKCLIFNGAKTNFGHGVIYNLKKRHLVHRLSYEKSKGEIPEGLIVRHTCDNPSCWNPEHLIVGTKKDNTQDMVERGRSANGIKHPSSKLTEKQVLEIKHLLKLGSSQRYLGKKYFVSHQLISKILNNKSWKYLKKESI